MDDSFISLNPYVCFPVLEALLGLTYYGRFYTDCVWRPLMAKVYDAPLALCDKRSIQHDQLIEEDKVYEDHWEEGLYLKYRPSQQWC